MRVQRASWRAFLLASVIIPLMPEVGLTQGDVVEAKLTPSDATTFDRFGASVALSGDFALVGAPGNESSAGAAYIFQRFGTAWEEVAKLVASDRSSLDFFGQAVALSGDYALVGAPGDDDLGDASGSAFVFERNPTTGEWGQQCSTAGGRTTCLEFSKVTAFRGVEFGHFGAAVALDGNHAFIGAPGGPVNSELHVAGTARLFTRTESSWVEVSTLFPPQGTHELDGFGTSVALTGGHALVGAPGVLLGDLLVEGAVHHFDVSGSEWRPMAMLTTFTGTGSDLVGFGRSVALDIDFALVGDDRLDIAAVFQLVGSIWNEMSPLTASTASNRFGGSVALNGDFALVGDVKPFGEFDPQLPGAAYLFRYAGTSWVGADELNASDGSGRNSFGESVALSTEYAIVGAPGVGAAYVYALVPPPPTVVPQLVSPADRAINVPLNPVLVWSLSSFCTPSGCPPFEFDLQVATTPSFDSGSLEVDERGIENTNHLVSGLGQGKQYYWQVRAVSQDGEGPWSSPFSFTTSVNPPADAPVLVSPHDGATAVSADPLLEWLAVGGATSYGLAVATTPNFEGSSLVVRESGIPNTSYPVSGLERGRRYYWQVRAANVGGTGPSSLPAAFTTYPAVVSVEINQAFGDVTRETSHRLVALPGDVDLSPAVTLEGASPDNWRFFRDNSETGDRNAYLEEFDGSSRFHFQPGRGFWLLSSQSWRVEEVFGTVSLEEGKYAISLMPGWNIISNPLDVDVTWSAVIGFNELTTSANLWQYEGAYSPSDVFRSAREGVAFYFLNDPIEPLEALIIPYPGASGNLDGDDVGKALPQALTLSAYREGQLVSSVRAGVAADAAMFLDIYDQFAPPGHFEAVSLRLVRDDLHASYSELSEEYRPLPDDGQTFDLVLRAEPHRHVDLKVDGLDNFVGEEVYLLDRRLSKLFNLHEQQALTLVPHEEQSRYALIVGSAEFVDRVQGGNVPEAFALLSNFPNPFNPTTVIEYAVPRAGDGQVVHVEIFNVLGQRVNLLASSPHEAGLYRIEWNGRDSTGLQLSSGTYFCRMRAERFSQTIKMLLLR